jgi:MFS family permease
MSLESNIKKFYVYKFVRNFSFWLPIFVLFFLFKGMNYTQIMTFAVGQAIFQIIFEVPSGVFADFFGRKKTLILSAILSVFCFSFMYFGTNFYLFMVGYIFFGMSLAFNSGSDSAFLYDTLKSLKRENEYKKVEGRSVYYQLMAMGLGSLVGGFLAKISLSLPVGLHIITGLISVAIALSFKEPPLYKESDDKDYFLHIKDAVRFAFNHPKVRLLILYSVFMMGIMIVSHRFLQPYLVDLGLDLSYIGIVYFVWLIIGALSAIITHKIENSIGEFYSLLIVTIFLGIQLIFISQFVIYFSIIVIFLGEFTWGFTKPLIKDYINKHVASSHRATILSLDGFIKSLLLVIIAPFFGYIADMYSITATLLIQGVFALVIGIPLVFLIKHGGKGNGSRQKV